MAGQLTHCHKSSTSHTGNGSHHIQRNDVLRDATPKTANAEDDRREKEARPSSKDVANSSVQRLNGCACDEARCRQPGSNVRRIEFGADGSIGGGCDCTVKGVEEDVAHDGDLDPDEPSRLLPVVIAIDFGLSEERRVFIRFVGIFQSCALLLKGLIGRLCCLGFCVHVVYVRGTGL